METLALALRPAGPALGSLLLGLASAGAVLILSASFSWPPWAWMWAMAFTLFAASELITCRNAMARAVRTTPLRVVAYWLAWPGMDAAEFLNREAPLPQACLCDALAGLAKLAAGAALIWIGADWVYGRAPLLAGWTGMAGIVLVLHFGLFQMLAWAWQCWGVPAQPIMRAPLRATGLSEFWGRPVRTMIHAVLLVLYGGCACLYFYAALRNGGGAA